MMNIVPNAEQKKDDIETFFQEIKDKAANWHDFREKKNSRNQAVKFLFFGEDHTGKTFTALSACRICETAIRKSEYELKQSVLTAYTEFTQIKAKLDEDLKAELIDKISYTNQLNEAIAAYKAIKQKNEELVEIITDYRQNYTYPFTLIKATLLADFEKKSQALQNVFQHETVLTFTLDMPVKKGILDVFRQSEKIITNFVNIIISAVEFSKENPIAFIIDSVTKLDLIVQRYIKSKRLLTARAPKKTDENVATIAEFSVDDIDLIEMDLKDYGKRKQIFDSIFKMLSDISGYVIYIGQIDGTQIKMEKADKAEKKQLENWEDLEKKIDPREKLLAGYKPVVYDVHVSVFFQIINQERIAEVIRANFETRNRVGSLIKIKNCSFWKLLMAIYDIFLKAETERADERIEYEAFVKKSLAQTQENAAETLKDPPKNLQLKEPPKGGVVPK